MTFSRRDLFALFALGLLLNGVFLLAGEYRYRDSIEMGYASMARFFSEHPDPFGWVPRQYAGLPAHLWYLPVMPFLGALAIKLLPWVEPYQAYRIVAVTLAALGPATLYLMIWFFGRSRKWALIGALVYTFCSFSYGLYPGVNFDRGISQIPWRWQALVKYGEGPHNAALMLLPLALIALWRAGEETSFRRSFVGAVLLAGVCLTNWVGALSLAWCCLVMLLTWGGFEGARRAFVVRALSTALLAYLLAAFWLTPRFIQTTLFNWPQDSINYKEVGGGSAVVTGLFVACGVVWALLRWWDAPRYASFLTVCWTAFAYVTFCHYVFGVDPVPEARRYALEFELFGIALLVELFRLVESSEYAFRREVVLTGMGIVAGLGAWQAGEYALKTWSRHQPLNRGETPEWRTASKLAELKPQGRVAVSGGTRFRLNAWFDMPQLGGTFESGLRNRNAYWTLYQFQTGMNSAPERRIEDARLLLRMAGVEYAAMHGPDSKEHYRDSKTPAAFSAWDLVWKEGDNWIYRLPFHGLAYLVKPQELPAVRPIDHQVQQGEAFVRALDDQSRPRPNLRWVSPSEIEVQGAVPKGYWMDILVSYDGGWTAEQDGTALPVERDPMDHLLLKPKPAANTSLRLRYRPTREHVLMSSLSGFAWVASLALFLRESRSI